MFIDINQINEQALIINFGNEITIKINKLVNSYADFIINDTKILKSLKIINCVPSFNKILIQFDPIHSEKKKIYKYLNSIKIFDNKKLQIKKTIINIPICYDEPYSLDFNKLLIDNSISKKKIIDEHLKTIFHVYMIGFLPGLPFMGNTKFNFSIPRINTPRLNIPMGSVGIVDNLCVIYPQNSPGGWNIIGRTPIKLFSKNLLNPFLIMPGFKIKFNKISSKEFKSYEI